MRKKLDFTPLDDSEAFPICPHCEKELTQIKYADQIGLLHLMQPRVFVCPHCLKVIGVGMIQ